MSDDRETDRLKKERYMINYCYRSCFRNSCMLYSNERKTPYHTLFRSIVKIIENKLNENNTFKNMKNSTF